MSTTALPVSFYLFISCASSPSITWERIASRRRPAWANAWLEHYRQFWERRLDALQVYVTRNSELQGKGHHMGSSNDGRHRVVIRRRMPAPREVVFEAWIDPEGMQEWMCPGDVVSAEAIMD